MPYPPGNPFPEFTTASPYQFNSFTNQMPQEYSNYNSPAPQPPPLPTLGPIFTTTFASDLEENEENLDSEVGIYINSYCLLFVLGSSSFLLVLCK